MSLLTRKYPVRLEELVIRCEECGETLAIVHALNGVAQATYLWKGWKKDEREKPKELPPLCHRHGIEAATATAWFHTGYMGEQHREALVVDYSWPGRDLTPLPDPPGQLELGGLDW